MMKILLSISLVTSVLCASPVMSDVANSTAAPFNKRALTMSAREALADEKVLAKTLAELKKNPIGISISKFVKNVQATGVKSHALNALRSAGTNACFDSADDKSASACAVANEKVSVEVPEIWLFEPRVKAKTKGRGKTKAAAYSTKDVLFAYAPEGDEADWTYVEAFDRNGNVVILDANVEPTVPVIVVETSGGVAFSHKVEKMNKMLSSAGLQSRSVLNNAQFGSAGESNSVASRARAPLQTTMMKSIRLENDQEPWVKGAAEIFVITSGVRSNTNGLNTKKNVPEVRITALHYLDWDKKVYRPNQLILFWDEHLYSATNIQFWEDDLNTNYQNLISVLIRAIAAAGSVAGQPEITAVANIADIIVNAIPSDAFKDNDDFVDTCYTIEKGKSYHNHRCAAYNATVTLVPYTLY